MSKRLNRRPRNDNEYTKSDKAKHENKKLKQELTRLRKIISRLESGWCPGCMENLKEAELQKPDKAQALDSSVKKDRTCYKCLEGVLTIVKYSKLGEVWYFRRCNLCQHKTRGKRWTFDVAD